MKINISQALRKASELKKKIADARSRAQSSITYKATQNPPFSFVDEMEKSLTYSNKLSLLQAQIAVSNANTKIEYLGEYILKAQAIKMLDEFKGLIAWLKTLNVLSNASVESSEQEWDDVNDKYINRKVMNTCVFPEAARAKFVDELQEKFNLLNGLVETSNQTTTIDIDFS